MDLLNIHQMADLGLLALRIAVGTIFLVHGSQKLKMWNMQPSEQMPASMLSTMKLLSIVEPLAGLAVLLGLLTQLALIPLGIIMIGAHWLKIVKMKAPFTAQDKVGWEFDFIILAATITLFFFGAGAISIDRVIFGI
ncbi:MAG: DoxX family protein [Patescibacteria group bacterium]|nr:DoxX family protein [Patescibacteria group bacterium]